MPVRHLHQAVLRKLADGYEGVQVDGDATETHAHAPGKLAAYVDDGLAAVYGSALKPDDRETGN